jgi:predicted acetyltransferase
MIILPDISASFAQRLYTPRRSFLPSPRRSQAGNGSRPDESIVPADRLSSRPTAETSLTIRTRAVQGAYAVEYILEDKRLSRLFVRDRRMRVGAATLRMGGIADVETEEHHRGRGYMRQVMERALVLMRDKGYEISTLFGISAFYPRWGYAPIFPETRVVMDAKDLASGNARYTLRRLIPEQAELTLDLYRRNNAERTGAIVRRRGEWRGFRQGSRYKRPVNAYGAFDGRGRLTGYMVMDRSPDEAIVVEVGYRRHDIFPTLLGAAARRARQVRAEHIQLYAPPDHPFVEFCQQLGCRVMMHYNRDGGAMGRIINLLPCFSRLAPELTRRLRATRADWNGRLAIETDIGAVTLRIIDGAVSCEELSAKADGRLRIGQGSLAQLLFGYKSAAPMLEGRIASLRGAPVEVIEALFPPGQAYVWRPDYF